MSALALTVLLLPTPILAFEPMPPIMQKLLEVFPEENGRFVDEPFGAIESMPKEARPLFETFRVVVPTPEDIDKNLARLFSASSHFPIKKITRYDKEPGAPGLPGFRGVWCQTEDESQIGFSIVTINQNRFLIWAKMGYYPAFANDSIKPTVRDQYARDVSQYLAGIDFKVPDNEAPQAGGRGLPEWIGLYPSCPDSRYRQFQGGWEEIKSWGFEGTTCVVPTSAMLESILSDVPDSMLLYGSMNCLQEDLQAHVEGGGAIFTLNSGNIGRSGRFEYVVDRYGRIRYQRGAGEGDIGVRLGVLFQSSPALSAGEFVYTRPGEYFDTLSWLSGVTCFLGPYYYRYIGGSDSVVTREEWDSQLRSVGYFLAAARALGCNIEKVHIYKDPPAWWW